MIFRSLDADGDWNFGAGKNSYATENNAIMFLISTYMKTFLAECFFNRDAGVPWFDLINQRNKATVVLYLKSIMSEIYGVLNVKELEYTYTTGREFNIKYSIETLYSPVVRGEINI